MSISSKITRFTVHQLPAYNRMQYHRQNRAEAAAQTARSANLANSFATIQNNDTAERSNLISRQVLSRLSKRV